MGQTGEQGLGYDLLGLLSVFPMLNQFLIYEEDAYYAFSSFLFKYVIVNFERS